MELVSVGFVSGVGVSVVGVKGVGSAGLSGDLCRGQWGWGQWGWGHLGWGLGWVGMVGVQITHMRTLTYTCVLAYKGWGQGWVCNCVIVYRFMGPACMHACV